MSSFIESSPEHALQQNDEALFPPSIRATLHIVSFLQWRFSLLPIGAYHWTPEDLDSPDGVRSEIYIAGDTPVPGRAIGQRPAITVVRSQLNFQGVGIGDMVDHNTRTGGKSYMDLVPTTLCVSVLSRLDFVAERLAWFVQDQLFTLREEIIRTEKCILAMGARTTMTPPSPAGALIDEAESDWRAVTLLLPFFLQHRTSHIPVNVPVLKKLEAEQKKR